MQNQQIARNLVIGLSILLILLIGGLFYIWNQKKSLEDEANRIIKEKNEQIMAAKQQLQIFKGKNAQLDSLIEVQYAQLDSRSNSIDSLIRRGRISQSRLYRVQKENKRLGNLTTQYLGQIDSLIEANERLKAENLNLQQEVSSERKRTTSLMDENAQLFNTVEKGKILKADKVNLTGVRFRSNGKEIVASRAEKVEQIKVCFKILSNKMTEQGNKDIMIRIIGPGGSTLYLEEAGSGKFLAEGIETLYTKKKSIKYQNQDIDACIYFKNSIAYQAGTYEAKIYSDGYLIGEGYFSLR